MQTFPATPVELAASLWRNRQLITVITRRDVLTRYRGSVLGLLWSFFNPLLSLSVYTFVFSEVFKSRWPGGGESKTEFALILFAGLIMFNLFAECMNRAPGLILSNVNYVKKVVFPLEVLPWVALFSAIFHMFISLLVWIAAYMLLFGLPPVTVVCLPLVVVPFVFLIMGLSWALASLGVYLRDVSQFIGIITTALMFLSPLFYPASAWPEDYRTLLSMNPVTPAIERTRDAMVFGHMPDLLSIGLYWLVTACIAWAGFAWFQKTRKGFSDVL